MAKFVLYRGVDGDYWWRYIANNGNIMADSGEGYVNKQDALRGIRFVKANAEKSPVSDET